MSCNDLHESFIESGDIVCPLCDLQLTCVKQKPLRYDCCESPDIINDDGKMVCQICGVVQGYASVEEYVDFHSNKHKLKRKSVYHRKYYIDNTLIRLTTEYNVILTYEQNKKIKKVFNEIGQILPQVNGRRKIMISLNFILRQVLKMMRVSNDTIPISKSKKTIAFYNQYWASVMNLIGDKLKTITQ